jgi:hypothetical protein
MVPPRAAGTSGGPACVPVIVRVVVVFTTAVAVINFVVVAVVAVIVPVVPACSRRASAVSLLLLLLDVTVAVVATLGSGWRPSGVVTVIVVLDVTPVRALWRGRVWPSGTPWCAALTLVRIFSVVVVLSVSGRGRRPSLTVVTRVSVSRSEAIIPSVIATLMRITTWAIVVVIVVVVVVSVVVIVIVVVITVTVLTIVMITSAVVTSVTIPVLIADRRPPSTRTARAWPGR